jgi:hypothetical protein
MTFPVLLNPLLQMAAAFVIFFAGFITLFSFCALCVVVGWALYRCINRLAILMARFTMEPRLALKPRSSNADARSATNPFNHAQSQLNFKTKTREAL